ncbi:MAG: DUF1566 domain-containing protein [bacterium]|nr:MAG: DUF1566 domain-containing protein [bacterium]
MVTASTRGFGQKWFLALALCLAILHAGTGVAEDRFVDNGDGTVTDASTRLMWAHTDNMGDINWHDAKLYCENFILGPYTDWRMPTIEELETLFDDGFQRRETVCGKKVRSAPQIELSCGFVWSSQVHSVSERYPIEAEAFSYTKGYRFSVRKSQFRGYRALPVRGGGAGGAGP